MSETSSNQEIFSPHQVNLRQWRQLIIPVPPQLIALLPYFFGGEKDKSWYLEQFVKAQRLLKRCTDTEIFMKLPI